MDIIDRLQKIKKLAQEGKTVGEKASAQFLFDKLVDQYDITPEQLNEQQTKPYMWECENIHDQELLIQILSKVIQNQYMDLIEEDSKIGLELTKLQYIEVDWMFGLYKSAFNKELKLLKQAFYKKHELFPPSDDDQKCNISQEEIQDIIKYFRNLKTIIPHKQIG